MTRSRRVLRRYQKSLAMLIMTGLLASMASAAGERSAPPAVCLQIAPPRPSR